jgi:heptose I phosphotransferase
VIKVPESWIERWQTQDLFKQIFALEGEIYRNKDGRKTLRFALDGKYYFAKLHKDVGWHTIIKYLLQLRLPVLSAENEWQAIQRLEKLGIHTMRLVAYGKKGRNPARLQSFVITEELAHTESLENFCRNWPTSPPSYRFKRTLIKEVARIARTLHDHGMNHRDFYICHFLLDISAGREYICPSHLNLYLIDLHRAQIRRRTPLRWRVKDIAALYFSSMDIGLTQRDLFRFIREYQGEPLKASLNKESVFWRRVKRRGIALKRKFYKNT